MADNTNKVTIDVAWFDELRSAANGEKYKTLEAAYNQVRKERDKLRAKLVYAEREEENCKGITTEYRRCRDNLAAAERCIEDIEPLIGEYTIGNCYPHGPAGEKMLNIIRAYRAQKEAK